MVVEAFQTDYEELYCSFNPILIAMKFESDTVSISTKNIERIGKSFGYTLLGIFIWFLVKPVFITAHYHQACLDQEMAQLKNNSPQTSRRIKMYKAYHRCNHN